MKLFLKRLVAYGLDFVLLAFVLVGIQSILFLTTSGFPFDYLDQGYEIEIWVLLTMSVPVWLYFTWREGHKGQTMGKRLLKLVVTNHDGSKIRFHQALIRTGIRLLPWEMTHLIILVPTPWWSVGQPDPRSLIWVPNVLLILYVIVLLASKGEKGLHDYITGTRVKDIAALHDE